MADISGSDQEFEAARLYQKHILNSDGHNSKVEVVAGIDNITVPGYDGIVRDSSGTPIANISIKTVQNLWSVRNRITEAITKIEIFSNPYEWYKRLSANQQWIEETSNVFGVREGHIRPSVVIIELKNTPDNMRNSEGRMMNDFKNRLSKTNLIDEIVVFTQNKIYRAYRGPKNLETEIRSIRLECRRLFN